MMIKEWWWCIMMVIHTGLCTLINQCKMPSIHTRLGTHFQSVLWYLYQKTLHETMELIQYNHTIYTASLTCPWVNACKYDKYFRAHLAKHPSCSWSIILQTSWNMWLTSTPGNKAHVSGQISNGKNSNKSKHDVCHRYNWGHCLFRLTYKFDHRCVVFWFLPSWAYFYEGFVIGTYYLRWILSVSLGIKMFIPVSVYVMEFLVTCLFYFSNAPWSCSWRLTMPWFFLSAI